MEKQAEAYSHYLTKWRQVHKDIEQPKVYGGVSDVPFSSLNLDGATVVPTLEFKMFEFSRCSRIVQTPDGRVIEIGYTSSGAIAIAYEFSSRQSWSNYKQPMSYNVYHELW